MGGIIAASMLVIGLSVGGGSAAVAQSEKDPELAVRTIQEYRFEHDISLQDAVRVSAELGFSPVSFRFENDQMVGEYSLASGISVDDYLKQMQSVYGTQPEIVGFSVPYELTNSKEDAQVDALPVGDSPEFHAPAVSDAFLASQREQAAQAGEIDAAAGHFTSNEAAARGPAPDWMPDTIQTRITKWPDNSGNTDFEMAVFWDSPSTPTYIPQDYGLEVGVELYNNASSTGLRPAQCPPGYKEAFFAKNYGWNWTAVDGWGRYLANAQPYADYNDLSDPCNRNSMTIGLRTPQSIPLSYNNAPYDWALFLYITAGKGTVGSSRISGDASLVTKDWCTRYPSYSSTDCMGVSANGSSVAVGLHRSFLGDWRMWTAPNKCWTSTGKGDDTPVYTIPSSSGC